MCPQFKPTTREMIFGTWLRPSSANPAHRSRLRLVYEFWNMTLRIYFFVSTAFAVLNSGYTKSSLEASEVT
jgi:hypothetical protein